MKTKLGTVIAIIISLTSASYGSLDKPVTREEFEQKVKQQQAKIEELETAVSEQEKQILDLKWQIYHLKHKPEPNEVEQSEDKKTETKKLQDIIKDQKAEIAHLKELCCNAGIDPNSEPNRIVKLRTEKEEKEYQQRLANYKAYFKRKNRKPTAARGPRAVPLGSEKSVAENRAIGISYYQVMEGFSNVFSMGKSPLIDGRERYLGWTADRMASLEIIGNKNNISEATLLIFPPSDRPGILARNAAMLFLFLKNTVPEWPDSSDWATETSKHFADSLYGIKVIGNKLITMQFDEILGVVTLTVEHK